MDINTVLLLDNTNTENIDFSKGTIVENNINPNTGTGDIIITTSDNTVKKTFENGVLTKLAASKRTFRQCFDQAYNDICDGAIVCASWYSSPLPALTAIAYCAATTEEAVHPDDYLPVLLPEIGDDNPRPTKP